MTKTDKKTDIHPIEVAQKIWLAGLGAYGRAFTEAAQGAQKINSGTSELFDDLVKRGSDIDAEMKSRIGSIETVQKASEGLSKVTEGLTKVTETTLRMQREQREAFESRMQRMRSALGFTGTDKTDKLLAKIEKLEDEVATLSSKLTGEVKSNDKDVTKRLARLSAEIDTLSKASAPASVAKPAVKKTVAKKTVAKKAPVKKAAPKAVKAAPAKAPTAPAAAAKAAPAKTTRAPSTPKTV